MNFDLRLPIGIMFTLFGSMLTIFGFATRGSEIYQHSLGININLRWGIVLLVFGIFMFVLAKKSAAKSSAGPDPSAGKPPGTPVAPPR